MRRVLIAMCLVGLLTAGCSDDEPADDPVVVPSSASVSASVVTSDPPAVAGPRKKTVFEHIRDLGVRPGSVDEFLIRDLLNVAEAQNALRAATGVFGTLEEANAAQAFRLRGGKVVVVSGDDDPDRFCLRAFISDDDVRVWFYDTDRVLPRGEFCA